MNVRKLDDIERRIRKERLDSSAVLIGEAISAIEDLQPYAHHELETKKCTNFIDFLCYRLDAIEDELRELSRPC